MTGLSLAAAVAEDAPDPVPSAGLLTLEGVTKRWRHKSVLVDVNLDVDRGELIWLEGANGAGKTTLLRIAAGMIQADEGVVRLDGLHPERDRREFLRSIGFLSAGDRALYPRLSARRQLAFAASLALIPRRERDKAVADAIDRFELADFAGRRADRLSTGQRQRLRFAMSLLHRPTLVVLDEPANSLDGAGLDVLHAYLLDLRRRGGAAIWTAPSGAQAGGPYFDRSFYLENGALLRK